MISRLYNNDYRSLEIVNSRKKYFNRLYEIIDKGEQKSIKDIIDEMKSVFEEEVELTSILKFIKYMANTSYRTKGDYMIDFIRCKASRQPLPKKPMIASFNGYDFPSGTPEITEENRARKYTERMKKELEEYRTNKTKIELDHYFVQNIKRDLGRLDTELVVDYLVALYDLTPISNEELDRFSYTLNFFIDHMKEFLEKFSVLDSNKEEDSKKIKELKIEGEEELVPSYKNDIGRLHTWKKNKIENELKYYVDLKGLIDKIMETGELIKPSCKPLNAKEIIERDAPFVFEYRDQIMKGAKIYETHFKSLKSCPTEKKEELIKTFNKKMLLQNNNIEN